MLKRSKQRRILTKHSPQSHSLCCICSLLPPSFICVFSIRHHCRIILTFLSDAFQCFGFFIVPVFYFSPTLTSLATVAWLQHGKNHINISWEEGIIATNRTGLEGKRTQCRQRREDRAEQRQCITGFGNIYQIVGSSSRIVMTNADEITYLGTDVVLFFRTSYQNTSGSTTENWI